MYKRTRSRRPSLNRRHTTADYLCLDITFLKKEKLLEWPGGKSSVEWRPDDDHRALALLETTVSKDQYVCVQIVFCSPNGGIMANTKRTMWLKRTKPQFGGFRYWLECPKCQSRTTKLYFANTAELLCRKCRGLGYERQYGDERYHYFAYARRIHERLGGTGDIYREGLPCCPKGMRYSTYLKLARKMLHYWEKGQNC